MGTELGEKRIIKRETKLRGGRGKRDTGAVGRLLRAGNFISSTFFSARTSRGPDPCPPREIYATDIETKLRHKLTLNSCFRCTPTSSFRSSHLPLTSPPPFNLSARFSRPFPRAHSSPAYFSCLSTSFSPSRTRTDPRDSLRIPCSIKPARIKPNGLKFSRLSPPPLRRETRFVGARQSYIVVTFHSPR